MVEPFKRKLRGGGAKLENNKPHLRGNCERCLAGFHCARVAIEDETSSEEEEASSGEEYEDAENDDGGNDFLTRNVFSILEND